MIAVWLLQAVIALQEVMDCLVCRKSVHNKYTCQKIAGSIHVENCVLGSV